MPYLHTLADYKGDFLWSTTDVAIWTTVEVGIGITAAGIATLRPLYQRFMRATGFSLSVAGTVLPWSRSKKQSRSATKQSAYSWRTRSENHALDEFRPRKDCAVTTTTVTAHAKSTSSSDDSFELRGKGSQEQIVSPDVSMGRDSMDAARPKLGKRAGGGSQWGGISKSVEFTTTEERELDAPHGADIEKDMPPLPAVVYERL